MNFAPASIPWFIKHELRLYWRSGKQVGSLVFLGILVGLLHVIALVIALVAASPNAKGLPIGIVFMGISAGLAFSIIIMTSRALTAAVQALYTRGDMDLLVSSPLDPNSIVAVRAAAIALSITGEIAIMFWPFANVFVLFGHFEWIKAYLLLPAIAMLATSLALVLMIALFRVLGPRRTRVFAQIMAAVLGMTFVVIGQIPNMMRNGGGPGARPDVFGNLAAHPQGPLWIPAAQVLNGFTPTLLLFLLGAAVLTLTVRGLGHRFIDATTLVASVNRSAKPRVSASSVLRFRAGLRSALIRKELVLIARDPWLLTQLLGQFVFIIPMVILLWRKGATTGTPWAWLMIIFLCGSITSALAWLTVSAEDAPELLASSPVPTSTIIRTKIEAALLPVVPLLLVPLFVLAANHAVFALALTVCATGAGVSCALLQIRNPVARKRADFKTRLKGRGLNGVIEISVIALWVGLCALVTALL
jgi:ABC-2 type transport system permease protein